MHRWEEAEKKKILGKNPARVRFPGCSGLCGVRRHLRIPRHPWFPGAPLSGGQTHRILAPASGVAPPGNLEDGTVDSSSRSRARFPVLIPFTRPSL